MTRDVPEKKLTIQVTDVDSIHVNYMDVREPQQREVGQDFTPQATCANDEDLGLRPQKVFDLQLIRVGKYKKETEVLTPSPAMKDSSVRGPAELRIWSMWS